jgi:hypothetical protein
MRVLHRPGRARIVATTAAAALVITALGPVPAAMAASSPTTSATTTLTLGSKTISGIPRSVAPGYHTFIIKESAAQRAKDPRGLTVLKLAKGYTRRQLGKDLAATFANMGNLTAWARVVRNVQALGGLELDNGTTVTGAKFTVLLKPGTYVLDNGASENGAPDSFSILTVKGKTAGAKPKTVGTITSKEFGFKVVGARHGLHTYALHDAGAQIHMYLFFRLDKGHSEAELLSALNSSGPPPAWVHNGGFAGVISGGQTMYTALNFSVHSNYELICFMPDVKTGAPHFALGMHRFFAVK